MKTVLLLILSLCIGFAQAQTVPQPLDGKTILNQVLAVTRHPVQGDSIWHSRYTVKTYGRKPMQDKVGEMDLYVGNQVAYGQSKDMVFFQDQKEVVQIFPQGKKILWRTNPTKGIKTSDLTQWQVVWQDSFLAQTVLKSCTVSQWEGEEVYLLQLAMTPTMQKRMALDQLNVWVDTHSYHIRRMEAVYLPQAMLEKEEIAFSKPEWVFQLPVQAASAQELVLSEKGQLQRVYQGYQLLDQRKK